MNDLRTYLVGKTTAEHLNQKAFIINLITLTTEDLLDCK